MTFHGVGGTPNTRSIEHLRLTRMTPASNRMSWTGSYEYYAWYLLLFPPGGAWTGHTWFVIVAPGQPDSWRFEHGRQYPWLFFQADGEDTWRLQARNLGLNPEKPDHFYPSGYSASEVAGLIDDLRSAPGVDREDLKDFLRAVIELPYDTTRSDRVNEYEHRRLREFLAELEAGR